MPFVELDRARQVAHPTERLNAVVAAAAPARARLLAEGPVRALKVCPLANAPYPTDFAFSGATSALSPYLWIQNRMLVIQFDDHAGKKRTLLFEPTDYDRAAETPFFKARREQLFGEFLSLNVFSKRFADVPTHLARLNIDPASVDYVAFDHLHTQDIRRWLPVLPNAKLLVHEREWSTATNPHPLQRPWYQPGAWADFPSQRLLVHTGDLHLGRGLAFIHTPGHTEGNMSLCVVTPNGLFVSSENGVATESWSPGESQLPHVRRYAEWMQFDVILNGNTRDGSAEQYTSMMLERALAGPAARNPSYYNVLPSSELAAWSLAPGLAPTFSHGDISF